jgi:hypothetical protein
MDLVVEKQVAQLNAADVKSALPIVGNKAKNKLTEFMNRLLNNNEPGFFFLDAEGTKLANDSVAFLNLSIAIKSDLHLQTCVEAKILQLTDTFQAKLGWLVGQLYSRVGTQDMEPAKLSKKITDSLTGVAVWVDDTKIRALEAKYEQLRRTDPAKTLSDEEIASALRAVPNMKQQVISRATEVLTEALGAGHESTALKLSKRLSNDAALTKLLK